MPKFAAFTLVEMVMTLMIASIIAIISVKFIGQTTRSMLDTGERQRLADTADIISEQISRRIRYALPGSLRVTNDGSCIEYMPLVATTAYIDLENNAQVSEIKAVPLSATESFSGYISIYPLVGNLYNKNNNNGPQTVNIETLPAGTAPGIISLSQPHRFNRASSQNRLFISADPEAICQDGEWLYLYRGYGFVNNVNQLTAALPGSFATGRQVLANSLQVSSLVFSYSPSSQRRNALVAVSFTIADATGNTLSLGQEVQVRNVP